MIIKLVFPDLPVLVRQEVVEFACGANMMQIIDLKATQTERAADAAERLQKSLQGELNVNEWDRIEDELIDAESFMAFENYDNPAEMRAAADYADEWFQLGGIALRVYYVCMAGPARDPCCTLILSKQWDTLHDDHMAPGQRWYCSCGARYRPKFGVVCEIVIGPNDVRHCRAECPDDDYKDVKFMAIEEQFGQRDMSPQDLFDAIPEVQPTNRGGFLRKIPTNPGHYRIDQSNFKGLGPMWQWDKLLALILTAA